MRDTVAILGVPVDDLTLDEALDRIREFIQSGRFHQVATANTDFLVRAMADDELRQILRQADMVLADGMPIVWTARLMGTPLRERVTGSDLVPRLATISAAAGFRIFMLGARPEVAQAAKDRLEQNNPGITIVGCLSPSLAEPLEMNNAEILAAIEAAHPDILLVAFGNPKQEKWIWMHRDRLKVPVCIGVGGTFDFIAGASQRAPTWMQKGGLEWVHRLIQNPARLWRRYGADIVKFSLFLANQMATIQRPRNQREDRMICTKVEEYCLISVVGRMSGASLEKIRSECDQAINEGLEVVFDFHQATGLDCSAFGTLINLKKRAAFKGKTIRLVGGHRTFNRMLRLFQADQLFERYPTLAEALADGDGSIADITVDQDDERLVVRLRSRQGDDVLIGLRRTLASLPPNVHEVVVNMEELHFSDTGLLGAVREASVRNGVRIRLQPSQEIRGELQRTGQEHLFDILTA